MGNEIGIRAEAKEKWKQHHGEGEVGTEAREEQRLSHEISRRQAKSGNMNVSPWQLPAEFENIQRLEYFLSRIINTAESPATT